MMLKIEGLGIMKGTYAEIKIVGLGKKSYIRLEVPPRPDDYKVPWIGAIDNGWKTRLFLEHALKAFKERRG